MKLSTHWLREYVAHDWSPEDLADRLTMSGLEVDGIEVVGNSFEGVVVGRVLTAEPHPNADRLTLCLVDTGADVPVQIVCGAPNVAAGQLVPVAQIGTTLMLPDRDKPEERVAVVMKKAKIRGEASHGMICAEDELGLSDDHSGIMVLPAGALPGTPFGDQLKAMGRQTTDAVLDIAITPNRPDAISHLGVARDVGALAGLKVSRPAVSLPAEADPATAEFAVDIQSPDGCHRYVGLLIRDVTIAESPDWLKNRLTAIGLRPRNNVVDITNFVMFECGQPLHAFDFDQVAGKRIVVRRTRAPQTFTTLDSKERTLPVGTLMIADGDRDVAIAGVMGGENSEVTDATTNVLLESAYFEPSGIRRTAKALQLQTDASYRFERGVDPAGQAWAAARAAQLISELAGGRVIPAMVDAHPTPPEKRSTGLRHDRITRVFGAEIPAADVKRLLQAIGFTTERVSDGWTVGIPTFRPDVEREIDVIEEVVRLYGLDRLPEPTHSRIPNARPTVPSSQPVRDKLASRLAGMGFRETFTNSMLRKETAALFADPALHASDTARSIVETLNPISQEMAALRPSLLPGLLQVIGHNLNHGQPGVRFFEFGTVYERALEEGQPVAGYLEKHMLILAAAGQNGAASWDTEASDIDFFDLKGAAMGILHELGLPSVAEDARYEVSPVTAHRIELRLRKTPIGSICAVHPAVADTFGIQTPVFVAELDFGLIVARTQAGGPGTYRPIERFPRVQRDLAVVVAEAAPAGALLATVRRAAGRLLRDTGVFDIYRGTGIQHDEKSVAFSLTFGADRTLRDREVDKAVSAVVRALESEHDARLRS